MKKVKKVDLSGAFNTASVKKGESFQIQLLSGGIAGTSWTLEVVSGKATKLRGTHKFNEQVFNYRAEEAGEIEIAATATNHAMRTDGGTQTFKIKVK